MTGLLVYPIGLMLAFSDAFIIDTVINLPENIQLYGNNKCSYWNYCDINPAGNKIAFIQPEKNEIWTYRLDAKGYDTVMHLADSDGPDSGSYSKSLPIYDYQYELVSPHGRNHNEVLLPIAVCFTPLGDLLVSDAGSRRISYFGSDNSLQYSFLLTGNFQAPNELKCIAENRYLLAGLNLDSAGPINAGNYCNIFSGDGEFVKSFAYTPRSILDANLWFGVSALVDVDNEGFIYVTFNAEGKIYKYNEWGILLSEFSDIPDWFIEPMKLPEPTFLVNKEPRGFRESWTRIIRLIYIGNGYLVMAALTNGKVPGTESPVIIDIYTTNGTLYKSGIESDYFPIGRDRKNALYFLSFNENKLVRTFLREDE